MLVSILKPTRFHYCFCFIVLLGTIIANAQQKNGKIAGEAVDENNITIPFVQVSLKDSINSSPTKVVLADVSGHFEFEAPAGRYWVELRVMGYKTHNSKLFYIATGQTQHLGALQLIPASIELNEVNITAPLAFVERRADKLIVNLNGLGSGAPILEVMNQLPGVTVTPDDRISLNGKSVQIYIDGKATTLSSEALSGFLRGMSSSAIQKVELIAQPSSKYDAAGTGAIINIIRKSNYKAGLNGNVYAGGGKGTFGKANGGVNLNYKDKAYNLLLNLDYNHNKYFYNSNILSNFVDTDGVPLGQSTSDIKSTRTNSNYTPNLGIDIYLSKRTTLSASIRPGFQEFGRDGVSKTNAAGDTNSQSKFLNVVAIRAASIASGLRLQHQVDTLGRELTVDIDYYRYHNNNDQNNRTITVNPVSDLTSIVVQRRTFNVYTLKMDYTHPLTKGDQLEMGIKSNYVNSENSNFYQDPAGGQTDVFDYNESISALYFTYGHTGKKFSYQLGIRGEYTHGEGEQLGTNHFTRSYFKPFPSIHLDYKLTENHDLSLGLNQRIERPGYESLNPLVRIISNTNLQQGNPALKPVIAYNADLWYGYKNALFVGVTYSYSVDDFTSFSIPFDEGIVTTLPGNADYSSYLTLQTLYGKQVLPWWYTSTNAILSKRSFKGEFKGALLQNDGIASLSATSYNNFSISKSFSIMLLFNYRGKSMERNITNQAFSYLTAGIRQQFLNKRASAQLNVMDIFKSYRNYYRQDSGNVQQLWQNQFETRMVKLSVSYNFGGVIKNTKKGANGDEEERKRSALDEK